MKRTRPPGKSPTIPTARTESHFRGKILKNIRRQQALGKGDREGVRLNQDVRFNPDCSLQSVVEEEVGDLLDSLLELLDHGIKQHHLWMRDLSVLLGNLLSEHPDKPRPTVVSISKNANDYYGIPSRYARPRYEIVKLLNLMVKKGLIGMEIGKNYPGMKRMTRIWALPGPASSICGWVSNYWCHFLRPI